MQEGGKGMNTKIWIELFGYLGSGLVVVSMLMSSVVRLRVINTIGSVIFCIYALIIHSYPTALMNLCLVSINIYHLAKLRNVEKYYEMIESRPDDSYLGYLYSFFKEDIARFFPSFSAGDAAKDGSVRVFTVCCESDAAGVLVGKQQGEKLDVLLDYSTPAYRDTSEGAFLYSQLPKYGIHQLVYRGDNADHIAYIKKMGFKDTGSGKYELSI